jgi:hypothetical protein
MESGEMHNVIAASSAVNDSGEVNPVVSKKQLAAEQKARREEHLLHLVESTTWQNILMQLSVIIVLSAAIMVPATSKNPKCCYIM